MNRLLEKQLNKYLNRQGTDGDLLRSGCFQQFLSSVDKAYNFKDKELHLLERAIDVSSQELNAANRRLKEQNLEISTLATTDTLTGLVNRRVFTKEVEHALDRAKRYQRKFAIMFIDLDKFKVINDTLGHHVGDLLLKQIAERLSGCVERKTDIIARIGGDEFTILLDEINSHQDFKTVAIKVLERLSKPFKLDGHDLVITVSIGISAFPFSGYNIVDLMKNADTAMYQAKEVGGNNYKVYQASMGKKNSEYLAIESRLRGALQRNEFVIHYQPQMEIVSGRITAVEALIRWRSPELGLLMPDDFIPMAEEMGLMVPIGEWLLETTCRQNRNWRENGLDHLKTAVNISLSQLQAQNVISALQSCFNTYHTTINDIEIELAESMVMHKSRLFKENLKDLKKNNIQIALDNFGTGHSSLSQLKQLSIKKLKIDRSFVHDIEKDRDARAMIEAIIVMSHCLNLQVLAEGVENASQFEFLEKKSCDQIQGNWLSEPLPANEAKEFILSKNRA